ncbi:DNA cytosine methyltransferase [Bartonella sp. HY038]|uniref:DNA cytosine methyltransferase n=1 Tax=Bartonella sp. HY038 TaxID=2759660 RepID=UPI0015FE7DE3|nr:DNA cytosine methyltransferase [Bartonella sp. HY038]
MTNHFIKSDECLAINVIDLFCGAGGLTHGLEQAGLNVKVGVDIDPSCKTPLEANNNAAFICRDIRTITRSELVEWFGTNGINVLAGCAPCQPFSTYSNTRKSLDERWSLLKEFERLVLATKPNVLTMENVPGLARQPVWKEFVNKLKDNNYCVSWSIVDCIKFGIPQTRRRLVLLASSLGPIELNQPKDTAIKTVRDTISLLPKIPAGNTSDKIDLHISAKLSPLNLKRIKASKPGGTWRDWPIEIQAKCHQKITGKTYPSVYGRMEWDKPSPTLTTQCFGYGNGRFGHPEQDRAISLREASMLQSFPPNYIFNSLTNKLSFNKIGMLIGNAVPPLLALHIGKTIKTHIEKYYTT